MSDRWIHDVSSSDDIDEHRCGFHGPIKKTIGKDEQILSSSHSRGKSSSQRRLLPPTPILLVVGSGESPRDMDSDEDDDDDSPPSRESHFVDSDFLDSSTPSSTTDVSLLQTNPSPCRRGRKLPSLPEPSSSCRKLSMQLQSNGKALAAPDEQSFGLSRNSTTRHMSMNNVLAAQTGKPVERQQNLEVPIGSLEAIFRRCSIFSKTSDNDVDDVNDEEDVDHKPISIITKGSRSVESICTARSEKEEPAGSPEPSLLTSSSATRLNAYSPGQTSTVARPGKLTEGAKRSSWPNANNIVPPLERRPSACDLGLLHFSVQYFPVRKRLRVSIAKAEGLAANLRPDLELSTFLKVFLSPGKTQKQKSHRLVKRSNDTVYNEEFFFVNIDTDDIRTKSVEIRLCHRTNKQFHHDLVVGEVKLPLWTVNELTSKHEIHFVRSLIPRQLKKLGRIHLSACLETAARRLTVNIAKIDDLPRFEISGLPDPFVRITLDQNGVVQTKQTRIIRGTSNPVFKEAVMFLISSKAEDLQNMKLLVSVIDGAASRTSNEVIGEVLLSNMSDEKSCLEQWRNMLQNPGKEVKASHSLKAAAEAFC
ncbi:C2 domain containing protein [Trichuris trichiura]|uniref:C2 domain containing protein n=1 Tax=Trichuris trichiura TaxID=36087 RepID=A0A077ZC47_TRITR|nr:C2 domain containing protein [Trichuris trichiura]